MPNHESGVAEFNRLLGLAEHELWLEFERARAFKQRGDIGDTREDALHRFLRTRLPDRYAVASGEVLDADGRTSGQTDLYIYDSNNTRPLYESAGNALLPAEALLATVEIKSRLSRSETTKSAKGLSTLRLLRPWESGWEAARRDGQAATDGLPRIFTSLFAYQTDLSVDDWGAKEMTRVREAAAEAKLACQHLDRVVVLDRGLLIPSSGRVATPSGEQGVLALWFSHLINFLAREVDRREPFPWSTYHLSTGSNWSQPLDPVFDAPLVQRATASVKLKARRKRGRASEA